MDKEELIANWGNLNDKTKKQILALADKEIKEKYFIPKVGELYYCYALTVPKNKIEAYSEPYMDIALDKSFISLGNCFRTEEAAIFAGWCDYYTKRFETYVNRHSKKLEWGNGDQSKYYVFYSLNDMDIVYDDIYGCKTQGTVYASSEQVLKDAINDIGKENFLKYVMKVEA